MSPPIKRLAIASLLLFPIFIFFSPVWLNGKMPIPADTIVGLYHPFRDVVWNGLTAGVPFKNFLITDAVRQQYPWRELAIDLLKQGELPLWNPYTFAGTPLLANIQTALFYPLNLLYFVIPFNGAWTIQVTLQPTLLAIFTFLYLTTLGISRKASLLGALTLALSGFSVAWLEWNTTVHALVWLPLALFAIEKLARKIKLRWVVVLVFSLASMLFAGFLQTAFYGFLIIGFYALHKVSTSEKKAAEKKRLLTWLSLAAFAVLLITWVQWAPTARLIANSARDFDQGNVLQREDWFLPWQNLVQFVAPDFFGNPSTLNYWGIFNYMEFVGYIGITPLTFALLGIFSKGAGFQRTKRFFLSAVVLSALFATPNPISRLPFTLKLPWLSSAQPSRLMIIADLSLAVLATLGFERFFGALSSDKRQNTSRLLATSLGIVVLILAGLWAFTLISGATGPWVSAENVSVAQRNLILPTILVIATTSFAFTLSLKKFLPVKFRSRAVLLVFLGLYTLTGADLLRFAGKFTPFTDPDYLFPQTETIAFLKQDKSMWRYMTTDRRIFPPNFSVSYRLQTIEGYDPLFLTRFGTLIASAQRGEPVLEPIPFHRIIRPDNYQSEVYDVLNVKYILALEELNHPKVEKVFQEGETRIYINKQAFPRAFLLPDYLTPGSDENDLRQLFMLKKQDVKDAQILEYKENSVRIAVDSDTGGMLVLGDSYYPGWSATVDGTQVPVQRVLYALRGTMIPPGRHEILYRYSQL